VNAQSLGWNSLFNTSDSDLSYDNLNTSKIVKEWIPNLKIPSNWNYSLVDNTRLEIFNPQEEKFYFAFYIDPMEPTQSMNEYISEQINAEKSIKNITIFNSESTHFLNTTGYNIIYTYFNEKCNCSIKEMYLLAPIGNIMYGILFQTEESIFDTYLPTISEIINSMNNLHGMNNDLTLRGVDLPGSPVEIVINPLTNKIYVATPDVEKVVVIDGTRDKVLSEIKIPGYPNSLAIDSGKNKIYVTNSIDNSIYIIDGNSDTLIKKIETGMQLGEIAIDSNQFNDGYTNLIFVTNPNNNSISVIDDITNKTISIIKIGNVPHIIALNPVINRVYVSSHHMDYISVLDYVTNSINKTLNAHKLLKNIKLESFPTNIVINSDGTNIYTTNYRSNTVSIINASSNQEINSFLVGFFPRSLVYNQDNNHLYVSNIGNNTLSVIDISEKGKPIKYINSSQAYDIAYNPTTKIIYLANYQNKSLTTINSINLNPIVGIILKIDPPGTGEVFCKYNYETKEKINLSSFYRLAIGSICNAKPLSGFNFDSWIYENSSKNLNKKFFSNNSIYITHHGMITAKFVNQPSLLQFGSNLLLLFVIVITISIILVFNIKTHFIKKFKLAEIDNIKLIEIDASIIVGILILLTLTTTIEESSLLKIDIISIWAATVAILVPFASSAILIMSKKEKIGMILTLFGFIILIIAIILIAISLKFPI
jgi:YVTN family beta-propeller protein